MRSDSSNFHDVDTVMALNCKQAFYTGNHQDRSGLRTNAMRALEYAYDNDLPASEETFLSALSQRHLNLNDEEKSEAVRICLLVSKDYEDWRKEQQTHNKTTASLRAVSASKDSTAQLNSTKNPSKSHVHGGSGYTGRLTAGFAAPAGSETFLSDDEPRQGLAGWVKKVTAAGAGAGFSFSELSGAKQPKSYEAAIPIDDLSRMRKGDLERLMDRATDPATFVRAMLAYYGKRMIVPLGNADLNSSNLNNPKNVRSMSQLDSLYNHMRNMDAHKILTAERATRFLVMCNDLLKKVKIGEPRSSDRLTRESYQDRVREVKMAELEIEDQLKRACSASGISEKDMRDRIFFDKKRRYNYDPGPNLGVSSKTSPELR